MGEREAITLGLVLGLALAIARALVVGLAINARTIGALPPALASALLFLGVARAIVGVIVAVVWAT